MNRMMKQHYVSPIRLAPAACGLVMLLGLTVAGIAQQAPVSAAPVAVAAESPNPAKPGSEGIKVHGHWVIDVKNPDGTLAQHRVFENSLKDSGYSLVGLLGGNYVTGDFVVSLTPLTGSGICPSNDCVMVQSLTGIAAGGICSTANCVVGLTKTVNANQGIRSYSRWPADCFPDRKHWERVRLARLLRRLECSGHDHHSCSLRNIVGFWAQRFRHR
jgi:hypothetical protein